MEVSLNGLPLAKFRQYGALKNPNYNYNWKYTKLIKLYNNKFGTHKVGPHEKQIVTTGERTSTVELWTEKFPELVQG